MATVKQYQEDPLTKNRELLKNPSVQAMLRTIRYAEGTAGDRGYNTRVGNSQFNDLSKKPGLKVYIPSIKNFSSAEGAYQFLNSTWDGVSKKLGLKDFSPESQDLAAIELIKNRGALQDVLNNNLTGALTKLSGEWASLPTSKGKSAYSNQKSKKVEDLSNVFYGKGVDYTNSVAPYINTPQVATLLQVPEIQAEQSNPLYSPTTFATPEKEVTTQTEEPKQNTAEQSFMQDLLGQMMKGIAYIEPEKANEFQKGGINQFKKQPFQLQDERNAIKRDNTNVKKQQARPIQQLNVRNKTDKEIAQEREARIQASVLAQKVPYTKENWREQLAAETAAIGDKLRFSNEPNAVDDSMFNPVQMIAGMASNLGQAPLQALQTDSNLPYFTAIGAPLAVGAIGGLGTKTTGQFVNNLVNPLAGTGDAFNNLGNKYLPNAYKYNPLAFKANPESYYRMIGDEGLADLQNAGYVRSNPNTFYKDKHPFFSKGYPIDGRIGKSVVEDSKYLGNNMIEVIGNNEIGNRFVKNRWADAAPDPNIFVARDKIGINNPNLKVYEKDWLKGYKEVPKSDSNPFVSKLQNLEKEIDNIKTKEASVNNELNGLTSQYKNKTISAEVFSKKAKELNLAELTYKKGELEKLKRAYLVQKDIHELPQENILRNENQLGVNISDGGSNNKGVFEVGDKYVAKLNAHGYDDASRLLAYKDKIKSNRISKTVQVKDFDGKVYQVQQKATGTPISKMTEEELKSIPKKHIDNFWKDKKELDNLGLSIDISGGKSNIIYDKNKGFQFIDLGIGKSPDSKIINEVFPILKLQQVEVPKPINEPMADLYRIQDKGQQTFAQRAENGNLHRFFNNPSTLARKAEEEKYFGQWFTNDKADLDWYLKDREFSNPEYLHVQVPKSQVEQYNISNFDKTLSRAPEREFILPKNVISNAKKYDNINQFQDGGTASDTIRINDTRKIRATTNKPINPNVDLVTGNYKSKTIEDIVNASLRNGVDPDTALALAMQESKLGNTDENLGHIIGGSYRGEEANDMTKLLSDKIYEGRKLGKRTDEQLLQMYNGTGKIFPTTEQDYHGFKMKQAYGVPIPKEGIDMSKTPLYGKQVIDIRDNVIKKNKVVSDTVKNLKGNFNHFEGAPYKKLPPMGEEIFQPNAFNNVNPKYFQKEGTITGSEKNFLNDFFKDGGEVVKDNNGYWNPNNWGKNVEISSPNITMKGVNQTLLGVANTGERKIMQPDNDYYFKGAKTVTEIPLTPQEEAFLRDIGGKVYAQDGTTVKLKDEKLNTQTVRENIPNFKPTFVLNKEKYQIIPTIDNLITMRPDLTKEQGIYFGTGDDTTYVSPMGKLNEVVINNTFKKKKSREFKDVKIQNEDLEAQVDKDGTKVTNKQDIDRVLSDKISQANLSLGADKRMKELNDIAPNTHIAIKKSDIIEIQKKLYNLGYDLGDYGKNKDGIDGLMGKKTKEALNEYNRTKGVASGKLSLEQEERIVRLKQPTKDNLDNVLTYLSDKKDEVVGKIKEEVSTVLPYNLKYNPKLDTVGEYNNNSEHKYLLDNKSLSDIRKEKNISFLQISKDGRDGNTILPLQFKERVVNSTNAQGYTPDYEISKEGINFPFFDRLKDEKSKIQVVKGLEGDKGNKREDIYRMYSGLPQKNDTFTASSFKAGKDSDTNVTFKNPKDVMDYLKIAATHTDLFEKLASGQITPQTIANDAKSNKKGAEKINKAAFRDPKNVMWNATFGVNFDKQGSPYLSFYDNWDLKGKDDNVVSGAVFGKPIEVYDRIPLSKELVEKLGKLDYKFTNTSDSDALSETDEKANELALKKVSDFIEKDPRLKKEYERLSNIVAQRYK